MSYLFDAANLLREARIRAGLTQRELAKRAGKAQSVIARIESGNTSPTITTRYAVTLSGIPLLFGGMESKGLVMTGNAREPRS